MSNECIFTNTVTNTFKNLTIRSFYLFIYFVYFICLFILFFIHLFILFIYLLLLFYFFYFYLFIYFFFFWGGGCAQKAPFNFGFRMQYSPIDNY